MPPMTIALIEDQAFQDALCTLCLAFKDGSGPRVKYVWHEHRARTF